MKKIYSTLFILLSGCTIAVAQEFRTGAVAGYNLNSAIDYKSQSGFHIGAKGELSFPQRVKGLYVDFGLMLVSRNWKSAGYYYNVGSNPSGAGKEAENLQNYGLEFQYHPYYLNVPVHIGYRFSVGRQVRLFAHAGPYLDFGLFGKAKEIHTNDQGRNSTAASTSVFGDKLFNRFDWGVGFRIGAEIARHVQFSVGYDWGMRQMIESDADDKNRMFTASCAYLF